LCALHATADREAKAIPRNLYSCVAIPYGMSLGRG
jgi:hypothetical protein